MIAEIIIGLVFIVVGVIILIYNYKNPNEFLDSYNWRGYIGGGGFVLLGIMSALGKGGDLIEMIKNAIGIK